MKKSVELKSIDVRKCVMLRRNPQYLTPNQMESLKKSIERDGFVVPILVRPKGEKYEIISGNHRFMAAKELGYKKVSAVISSMNDKQSKRLAINLNTVHGNPNAELLAPFLADMEDDVLKTIHLDDGLLDEIMTFDEQLKARLKKLEPPDALNRGSNTNIPDCVCEKCGSRHVTARRDLK